jgi:hypothetical protein
MAACDNVENASTVLPSTVIEAAGSVREGVPRLIASLPHPELVVVTGSPYVVTEARGLFHDLVDPGVC